MNRKELSKFVAYQVGLSEQKVDEILSETFRIILLKVSEQEPVSIVGFGRFEKYAKAPFFQYNPRTGQKRFTYGGYKFRFVTAKSVSLWLKGKPTSQNWLQPKKVSIER